MPKPPQVFLLEVSYPEGSYYLAPGGGIFRTEKDMRQRIKTVKSRAASKNKAVKLTTHRLDADWEQYDIDPAV